MTFDKVYLMSKHKFDDDCPGCRPALVDVETGKAMPQNHPTMVRVNEVWAETTLQEREAFHQVTCLNNRSTENLKLAMAITRRIQDALRAMDN
jgi:hypothetical protein